MTSHLPTLDIDNTLACLQLFKGLAHKSLDQLNIFSVQIYGNDTTIIPYIMNLGPVIKDHETLCSLILSVPDHQLQPMIISTSVK